MPRKRQLNAREYHRLLLGRQLDERKARKVQSSWHVTHDFIKRLSLVKELEGHEGCVNCLEWNDTGTILASASDDVHFILWDPFRYKKLHAYETGHRGNIFSVKFMPNTRDNTVVTGAGDCRIRVHDVVECETTMICSCHAGRVKRLATAPYLPYMFWSAAEDGLIMEFDLRTSHVCEKQGNNVLINLYPHMGRYAEAKCLAINPARPELLAVGANDPYIRLYDRRMITPIGIQYPNDTRPRNNFERYQYVFSNVRNTMPDDCAQYFVSGHLPMMHQERKKRNKNFSCTYLTFSPAGTELLANMGGEQIYLFDINNKRTVKKYSQELVNPPADETVSGELRNNDDNDSDSSKSLVLSYKNKKPPLDKANYSYDTEFFSQAINNYNLATFSCPNAPSLYRNRASALMKRNWEGDMYAAYRDLCTAIEMEPTFSNAHYRLAKCLFELNLLQQAQQCLADFSARYPDIAVTRAVKSLALAIDAAIEAPSSDSGTSDDEVRQNNTTTTTSNTSEFPISEQEEKWRLGALDYEERYCGHCNTTTDIKEANFFGRDGQYIVAGSDDGSFYVWDRYTTNIVAIFKGDESIVNCLQPHPTACLLATSGIEPVVRLWSPISEESEKNDRAVPNFHAAALANQQRMNSDPFESMLINLGIMPDNVGDPAQAALAASSFHCGTS